MEERDYYLGFSLVNGIGPKTFKSLLQYFKTAERAWNSTSLELKKAGLGEKTLEKFITHREEFHLKDYQEKLKLKKACFLALCDKNYPKLLSQIDNPPIVLFVKGDVSKINFDKTIGIVGTRKITNYGKEVTKLFSYDLAANGFTIVSGLAMGVDAQAAWSAIEAKSKTIAVLGNGVDLCFPSSNEDLYDKILDASGIIVSEFPLGQTPTVGSFPSRNRIIAGLSLGVLVTEGDKDSGSLITAKDALKFNRPVFAIPGPITSSLSKGPLTLIEKGAKLVVSADDILRVLNVKSVKIEAKKSSLKTLNLSKEELKIMQILENEPLHFDEIVRRLGLSASVLGGILSVLEVKSLIKLEEGSYKLL